MAGLLDQQAQMIKDAIGRKCIEEFMARLSPEVQEIVRLDLIQTVGNALRTRYNTTRTAEELDAFVEQELTRGDQWSSW